MNWIILIVAMSVSALFGFFIAAICGVSGESDKRIQKIRGIEEATEEIIQVAIDHVDCRHRTEGDADYDIDKAGEQKIRKILGGLI